MIFNQYTLYMIAYRFLTHTLRPGFSRWRGSNRNLISKDATVTVSLRLDIATRTVTRATKSALLSAKRRNILTSFANLIVQ